jgi:hypothetical protein
MKRFQYRLRFGTVAIGFMVLTGPTFAERVTNPIAVFNGLDKVTGITTRFEVKVKEEGTFGGLLVKPLVCFSRPITEAPKTTSFVTIEEGADAAKKKIFSGWMFAESPGLNSLEHPIIDIWLTGCMDPNAPPPPVENAEKKPVDGEEQSASESGDTGEEAEAPADGAGAGANQTGDDKVDPENAGEPEAGQVEPGQPGLVEPSEPAAKPEDLPPAAD